ncbi:MAG: Fe2+-dependent dioxygenase [Polyangiales bacterium]
MLLRFPELITADEHARLLEIARSATFVDGRESASPKLAETKNNEQMSRSDPAMAEVARIVGGALERCVAFRAATLPKQMHSLRLSRYVEGMRYGKHVDSALMHDGGRVARADLSFTLFLAEPSAYEGGELCLETGAGETVLKPPARDAVVYPTGELHEVRTVTKGERLVVVGWVQSFVRAPADRALLWDLAQAMDLVYASEGKSRAYDLLVRSHTELLRRWVEP